MATPPTQGSAEGQTSPALPEPPSDMSDPVAFFADDGRLMGWHGTSSRGIPAIVFTKEERERMCYPFRFSHIGKFSKGRPPMKKVRVGFRNCGFKGNAKLVPLDENHILITFDLEEDSIDCSSRDTLTIGKFKMPVFKWTPNFQPTRTSPLGSGSSS